MGAKKGNQNKKGKPSPGSGRKSLREELSAMEELKELWGDELPSESEVEKMLKDKKKHFTSKDIMKMKLALGNDRALLSLFDKIFPDQVVAKFNGGKRKPLVIIDI